MTLSEHTYCEIEDFTPRKSSVEPSLKNAHPLGRVIGTILQLNSLRKAKNERKQLFAELLKENNGVIWNKPKALRQVRRDWRFSDEMESDGQNPGDDEMEELERLSKRKKKMMTKKERMNRQVETKDAVAGRKIDLQRRMNCKKNLRNFIEKLNNGVTLPSVASKGIHTTQKKFQSFGEMRDIFARNNLRDAKRMDVSVEKNISRRLANPDIDERVRIVYEVVLENYDSVLGSHFYYFFQYKQNKCFVDLEKFFLLNR